MIKFQPPSPMLNELNFFGKFFLLLLLKTLMIESCDVFFSCLRKTEIISIVCIDPYMGFFFRLGNKKHFKFKKKIFCILTNSKSHRFEHDHDHRGSIVVKRTNKIFMNFFRFWQWFSFFVAAFRHHWFCLVWNVFSPKHMLLLLLLLLNNSNRFKSFSFWSEQNVLILAKWQKKFFFH